MKRAELDWLQLGFPRDLTRDGCLAALASFSGMAHATRLVFDLEATRERITHRIGVPPSSADIIAAMLRAAVPSLRLEKVDAPVANGRRIMWQLTPRLAALRSDDPGSVSAALLASLFPLNKNELVRLRWTARPATPPKLDLTPDDRRDGRARALSSKLSLPVLDVYGELLIRATSQARCSQLTRRVGTVLWSLGTPFGRLRLDPVLWGWLLHVLGLRGRHVNTAELASLIGWPIDGPDLPGLELGAAKRLVPSGTLPRAGRVLGVSDFSGFARPVAITPEASTRGLYVLGPTGTGKTSLLKNLIRDDLQAGRGLAVVETNGDLIADLLDLIPPHRLSDVIYLDPTDRDYAVGFNPFAASADASLVADQLGELFQRLWKDFWGPRTGQLAHMGLLTLARRKGSTLVDLPRLFLDPIFRGSVLRGLDDPVGLEPDWRWFASLSERERATVIAPLLNKVRAFTARDSIRSIVGQAAPAISMRRLLSERKVLLVNLPKGLIGAETSKLLGCLVLTSLWQAVTERAGVKQAQRHPFGLYVDEVQDFAAAPIPWDEIFAQGRKYGLSTTVAHQNLGQLPRELRDAVLANARSKAMFALSAADASKLEPLFAPALKAADLQDLDAYSVAAVVALENGAVARPVTLRTPPPPEAIGSADSVRRASRQRFARARTDVEQDLRRGVQVQPKAPVGRKRRRAS